MHERSVESDLVLGLLRELLRQRGEGGGGDFPKLLLMSATLDAARYEAFFASTGASVASRQVRSAGGMLRAVMPETKVKRMYLEEAGQLLRAQGLASASVERALSGSASLSGGKLGGGRTTEDGRAVNPPRHGVTEIGNPRGGPGHPNSPVHHTAGGHRGDVALVNAERLVGADHASVTEQTGIT